MYEYTHDQKKRMLLTCVFMCHFKSPPPLYSPLQDIIAELFELHRSQDVQIPAQAAEERLSLADLVADWSTALKALEQAQAADAAIRASSMPSLEAITKAKARHEKAAESFALRRVLLAVAATELEEAVTELEEANTGAARVSTEIDEAMSRLTAARREVKRARRVVKRAEHAL